MLKEAGPPHMKSFVVRVTVGEFSGEGEGKSKKIAKKLAAIAVLEELRRLPQLPVADKIPLRIKKKSKSIIKVDDDLDRLGSWMARVLLFKNSNIFANKY